MFLICILLCLFACSNQEAPDVIGSWSKNCSADSRVTYVFYATGNYSITGNREFLTGHWERAGNQFYMSSRGAHTTQYDIINLTHSQFHIRDTPESDIIELHKCKEVKHGSGANDLDDGRQ
jgi:hypothetical protein